MCLSAWFLFLCAGAVACDVTYEVACYIPSTVEEHDCTSFPTLETALVASSGLPTATISLVARVELSSWTVSNSITLMGNWND